MNGRMTNFGVRWNEEMALHPFRFSAHTVWPTGREPLQIDVEEADTPRSAFIGSSNYRSGR